MAWKPCNFHRDHHQENSVVERPVAIPVALRISIAENHLRAAPPQAA
jgi:hypothetical protein